MVEELVYVRDAHFEWLPAVVLKKEENRVLVRIDLPSNWAETTVGELPQQERWVHLKDYFNHALPQQNNRVCRDLANLTHVHEAALLYQIKERYIRHLPYTRVGDILVAINAGPWIPGLYSHECQRYYTKKFVHGRNHASDEKKEEILGAVSQQDHEGCEPHVYEVSSLAYRGVMEGKDQAILATGETGSGKTESIKIVLEHLVNMRPSNDLLVQQILQSTPIFKAFGSAKTRLNPTSTRFGLVTKLRFTEVGHLAGAMFDTYFLETSRAVSHADGDGNFRIFYEILAAPPETKRELLGADWALATSSDFAYLSSGNRVDSETSDWEQTFQALALFGLEGPSLRLTRALGVVLLLGNISFVEETDGGAAVANRADLNMLALSLGLPVADVEDALTHRMIQTANEDLLVSNTADQAVKSRDTLAKVIYAGVFSSIVSRINILTSAPPTVTGKHKTVALLDLFGFECSSANRFEQFCVNYANEKMQRRYILDSMGKTKAMFDMEGIDLPGWKDIDNSSALELLEGSSGIIRMLNEQSGQSNGTSETFVFKVKQQHKGHSNLVTEKLQLRTEFGVRHFAGPVRYDAGDFVESNSEQPPSYLISIASRSTNGFIAHELRELAKKQVTERTSTKSIQATYVENFSIQVRELMASIGDRHTRYIRCVKPSSETAPSELVNHKVVLRQLRSAGLLTAVELSREVFPDKLPFKAVTRRFMCLMRPQMIRCLQDLALPDKAQLMMSILFSPFIEQYRESTFNMPFACGYTKVFFRSGGLQFLELQRQERCEQAAEQIQKSIRKSLKQRRYLRIRLAVITLQALFRSQHPSQTFMEKRSAAIKIQATVRSVQQRADYLVIRSAAHAVVSWWKTVWPLVLVDRQAQTAKTLTSWSHSKIVRCRYRLIVHGVALVQAKFRSRTLVLQCKQTMDAGKAIVRWSQSRLIRWRFVRMRLAASALTRWSRGRAQRVKFRRMKAASTLLSAPIRPRQEKTRFRACPEPSPQCEAAVKFQATTGREESLSENSESNPVSKAWLDDTEICRRRVEELHHELLHVTKEAELRGYEAEAEYEERLAEYEDEVLALKETIMRHEIEKVKLRAEVQANVDNLRSLKDGIRGMQESHRQYLDKVMHAIEKANIEHAKVVDALKHDRDSRVSELKAQIKSLKKRQQIFDMSPEQRETSFYRLARKLEKITSPDFITATVNEAGPSDSMIEFIDGKVSAKCRNIIYRLEDIAAVAKSQGSHEASRPGVSENECVHGLQQQLVDAYEEIERLQKEVRKSGVGPQMTQKRGLRRIF